MKKEKFIKHITLQTHHVTKIQASDIGDEAFLVCKELIAAALEKGGLIPITGFEGFYFSCQKKPARVLVGQVFHGVQKSVLLLDFVVVGRAREAVSAWQAIHHLAAWQPKTSPDTVPPDTPFMAVSLSPDLTFYHDATQWLGDFERCMAWAWVN